MINEDKRTQLPSNNIMCFVWTRSGAGERNNILWTQINRNAPRESNSCTPFRISNETNIIRIIIEHEKRQNNAATCAVGTSSILEGRP